jgi:hypothetical protein
LSPCAVRPELVEGLFSVSLRNPFSVRPEPVTPFVLSLSKDSSLLPFAHDWIPTFAHEGQAMFVKPQMRQQPRSADMTRACLAQVDQRANGVMHAAIGSRLTNSTTLD